MSETPSDKGAKAKAAAAEKKAKAAAAASKPRAPKPADYEPRMKARYRSEIRAKMKEQFNYTNEMQIPAIDKVVINMGVGEAVADSKKLTSAMAALAAIAGQKPIATKSKKSIAQFKLREGMSVGCKVTLRKDQMYEFLDRLVTIALPRVKDFRGLKGTSFAAAATTPRA